MLVVSVVEVDVDSDVDALVVGEEEIVDPDSCAVVVDEELVV